MSKFNKNEKIKTIIITVVIVALSLGSIGILATIFAKDNSVKLDFSLGALNASGQYEESEKSIYTKNSFEFDTVKVTRDFESNAQYQLFFYDELDNFVSSSEKFSGSAEITAPEGARFARIVITPVFSSEVDKEDQIVKKHQVSKYANEFTFEITVIEETEDTDENA